MKSPLPVGFAALALIALAGCTFDGLGEPIDGNGGGESDDGERVFGVAARASNLAVVTGIWEATTPQTAGPLQSVARFEFRAGYVVAAARCTMPDVAPVTVGGRAVGNVSSSVIELKQAISAQKPIGNGNVCGVSASAGTLPACNPLLPAEGKTSCFELNGGGLIMYQGATPVPFAKISD